MTHRADSLTVARDLCQFGKHDDFSECSEDFISQRSFEWQFRSLVEMLVFHLRVRTPWKRVGYVD